MTMHSLETVWRHTGSLSPTADLPGIVSRVYSQGVAIGQKGFARKTAAPRQQPGADFVEALGHGLRLLECWQGTDVWLTNSELAQRSGLTRSTVSRLTAVLFDLGYLFRDHGNRLRLTATTLGLGFGNALAAAIVSKVKPELVKLAGAFDVYAALGIRIDNKIQILENVASTSHPDAVVIDVGCLLPICRSASGLAVMSALPQRDFSPLICRLRSYYGERWGSVQRLIDRKKAEYFSTGYCTAVGTVSQEVGGLAVPIMTAKSNDIFVLACAMRARDFCRERVEQGIAPRLLNVAESLTATLL